MINACGWLVIEGGAEVRALTETERLARLAARWFMPDKLGAPIGDNAVALKPASPSSPKHKVGDVVTLKSGTLHKVYAIYEYKADRGFRYSTMTVRADGTAYGPWRNITDKTPTR